MTNLPIEKAEAQRPAKSKSTAAVPAILFGSTYTVLGTARSLGRHGIHVYCASEGLGAVVRGSVPRPELSKALNLRPDQRITLAQTVGYIKK